MLLYQNTCDLHTELANTYAAIKDFPQALRHYNVALSLSSQHEPATSGLDRLEKMMRGEDPDEEMGEEGVGDGDETDGSVDI